MIGVYPPGSIVEMVNGEVGIVVESRPEHKLKPCVLLVRESDKSVMAPYRTVDLKVSPEDASGEIYRIAREVPDGTYDIVLQEFVDQGLIVTSPEALAEQP